MDDSQLQLLKSTVGVVFLGSPLRGTPYARAVQWIVLLAKFFGKSPSDTLVRDLVGDTGVLDDLIHRFSYLAKSPKHRFQVRCFFETQKSQVFKLLDKYFWISKITRILVRRIDLCLEVTLLI
jgi:hypothetical protein